jgi:hypothetical protein
MDQKRIYYRVSNSMSMPSSLEDEVLAVDSGITSDTFNGHLMVKMNSLIDM